jgi:lysylphosphatidylglycerol synthetase-like protein (DUF2156 family)
MKKGLKKICIALIALIGIWLFPLSNALASVNGFWGNRFPDVNADALDPVKAIDALFALIWPIVVAIIIITFIYAGVKLLLAQGDPTKVADARRAVLWGVGGVIVIVLSFSVISFVNSTLNPPPIGACYVPDPNSQSGSACFRSTEEQCNGANGDFHDENCPPYQPVPPQ